ncbi:MAG: PKD domain-containing protein [Ignavibacteriae bacterium]|nr:PKD domain-containing protein [Ignavibacteriota bacterium]
MVYRFRFLLQLPLFFILAAAAQAQTPLWTARHDAQGASIDEGRFLLRGPNGASIIVGSSIANGAGWQTTTGWDVVLAAVDSSGTPLWNARYDGPDHNDERALCAVAGGGNIYVGARGWSSAQGWRGILLAYNSAGTQVWMRNVGGLGGRTTAIRAIALDAAGNIFAAAHSETPQKSYTELVSYSKDGDLRWRAAVDTTTSADAAGVVVLNDGSIMLGITRGGALRRASVVSVSAAGAVLWEKAIPAFAHADCGPIVQAAPDAVFLAATLAGATGTDVLLARVSANSTIDWHQIYAGPAGRDDRPAALTADTAGNMFASLRSDNADGSTALAVVKYSRTGIFGWAGRYDSSAAGSDTQPPLFAGAAIGRFENGRGGLVEWSGAFDDYSEPSWIRYKIYVSETSGSQDFLAPAAETLGVTHAELPALQAGRDYFVVVRAFDATGNGDRNTREVRITVPAPPRLLLDVRRDTVLAAGVHCFDAVHVAAGAKLRFLGPATLCARDSIVIAGTVEADCHALVVRSNGDLSVRGRIENRCVTGDSTRAGDLTLFALGALTLDSASNRSGLYSSGRILVTDDSTFADWKLAIPPFARSATPVPPVGSLDAAQVLVGMTGNTPADVTFYAEGADPDGGPVRFDIDFGDGQTRSSIQPDDGVRATIEKSYTAAGTYRATLVIHDDEGDTARVSLTVLIADSTGETPAGLALTAHTRSYAIPVGDTTDFSLDAGQLGSDTLLSVLWNFGDGATSTSGISEHAFAAPGRYRVSLTVGDDNNRTSESFMWLWVYRPDTARRFLAPRGGHTIALAPPPPVIVGVPIFGNKGDRVVFPGRDINFIPGAGIIGANGANGGEGRRGLGGTGFTMWAGGKITITGGVYGAGNGGAGGDASKFGSGKPGGRGGDMNFQAHEIDISGGVFFGSDGGAGGADVKVGGPGQSVSAYGGDGGKPGSISFRAGKRIRVLAPVSVILGNGGAGGEADATGGAGIDRCTRGQDGGSGTAKGGVGGFAKKRGVAFGDVQGAGLFRVSGAIGGIGGLATAVGGKGGSAINCKSTATGGKGGNATATGGKGGDGGYSGIGVRVAPVGDGGLGGHANATPGAGGDADAKGDPMQGADGCPGQDGGDATATGGDGGRASAKEGKGGKGDTGPAPDGASVEIGSNGGSATAQGGNGGNGTACGCNGGNGGEATATSGKHGVNGGRALVSIDGIDGDATATGGKGGSGGSCCPDPKKGGDGGAGGAATANAQVDGTAGGSGGSGGNGGDGCPIGAGGALGAGTGTPNDIADGAPGAPGVLCCPVPVPVKFKTPCTGTAVPITPGNVNTWEIWNPSQTTHLANLSMRYMTDQEAGGPVNYQCFEQNTDVGIQSGGMIINLASIVDLNSPSKQWTCTYFTFCAMAITPGEVTVTGYRGGQEVATKTQQLTGIGTVTIEAPPGERFDEIRVLVYTPVRFNWWWQTAKCTGP